MTTVRAGDVEMGAHVRIIDDLIEEFGEVINVKHNGDDVLLTLSYPKEVTIFPVDLPALGANDMIEVLA